MSLGHPERRGIEARRELQSEVQAKLGQQDTAGY